MLLTSRMVTVAQVHVVLHEGTAKMRYFDVDTGALRRTLQLQGCRVERAAQDVLGFPANCVIKVALLAQKLSDVTLMFDDEATATQWQAAIQFAVSSTATDPATQIVPLSSCAAAACAPNCTICLDDIVSSAEVIYCPCGQHFIHKGECFRRCVEWQIDAARQDPGQFDARGGAICCPACKSKGTSWADADIKRLVESKTWQARCARGNEFGYDCLLRAFCMNNRISQAFLKLKQEESAASKLAERDRLLRLLPRDRMYQVSKACCRHDALLPPTQLPVSEMQRAS